jgi:hypothetical protein
MISIGTYCFFQGLQTAFNQQKRKHLPCSAIPSSSIANLSSASLFTKFLLSTLDIVTDLLTAREFISNGDFYWGILTILLIFAPFAARVTHTCVRIAMCFKIRKDPKVPILQRFSLQKNEGRLKVLFKEMPSFLWNFPLFQPIRQAKILFDRLFLI